MPSTRKGRSAERAPSRSRSAVLPAGEAPEIDPDYAPSFNLIDERWLPVVEMNGGLTEVGLAECLRRAYELRELVDASPLVTIALHRLILALLHRVFGPSTIEEWGRLWKVEQLPAEPLATYLAAVRDRFDLFSPTHPFYQIPGRPNATLYAATRLAHELASEGNAALLFDHTLGGELSPSKAARYLIAQQCFGFGGTLGAEKGGKKKDKHAKAGPLTGAAVALVKSGTLKETLLLNLQTYDLTGRDPLPYPDQSPNDCPAWERNKPTARQARKPDGYLDLLTWQSRQLRLFPESTPSGPVVRWVAMMPGHSFPEGWSRHGHDTMLAFKKNTKMPKKGKEGTYEAYLPLGLSEERAVWRDSHALFQSLVKQHERPMVLDWLQQVIDAGYMDWSANVPLDVFGMVPDRASTRLWRHERLTVQVEYLRDRRLHDRLGEALDLAGKTCRALEDAVEELARHKLSSTQGEEDKVSEVQVKKLKRVLFDEYVYWAKLEPAFRLLLAELPKDHGLDQEDSEDYGQRRLPEWARYCYRSALATFDVTASKLDDSARSLRAVALAGQGLRRGLGRALGSRLGSPQAETQLAAKAAAAFWWIRPDETDV